MSETQEIPLFPLHTVLYPGMPLPLHIFEERYRSMIGTCIQESSLFGVVLIQDGDEVGQPAIPHEIGTSAIIVDSEYLPDGRINISTVGYERFRIREVRQQGSLLIGVVEDFPLGNVDAPEVSSLAESLSERLRVYLDLLSDAFDIPGELQDLPEDPVELAYLAAIVLNLSPDEKQRLLATPDVDSLLKNELRLLGREADLLRYAVRQERHLQEQDFPFSMN